MLLRYTAVVPIMSYAASYALHVAYRVLYAMCCMLYPACCMPYAACCMYVVCCVLHAACCMLRVACCVLHAACCMLDVVCFQMRALMLYWSMLRAGALQLTHRGRFSGGMRHGPGVMSVGLKVSHQPKAASPQAHPMAHATPKVRMLSARTDAPTSPRTHSSMAPNGSATCEADRRNATHDVATLQSCSAGCVRSAPTGAMTSCTASASSGAI